MGAGQYYDTSGGCLIGTYQSRVDNWGNKNLPELVNEVAGHADRL